VHALQAVGAAELGEQQGQFHVALGRQHRHQVVELEDESDVPRPPGRELAVR